MEISERGSGRGAPGRGALRPSPPLPRGLVIPAKAGTYWLRPDSSTLSRRVRGVLSPYRERGIRHWRASNGREIPAYAGMTVERRNDGKGDGNDGERRSRSPRLLGKFAR